MSKSDNNSRTTEDTASGGRQQSRNPVCQTTRFEAFRNPLFYNGLHCFFS
jgi:hypothetical protein